MRARIRHRVAWFPLSAVDRARGYTAGFKHGEVIVMFSRPDDASRFLEALPPRLNADRRTPRTVYFNCDPDKEHCLAQTVGAIVARLEAIEKAEDDIATLIKGRGGLEKIAW